MNDSLIDELIQLAFKEDIQDGDHSSLACIPNTEMGKAKLLVKEAGIIAGVEIAQRIFHHFDESLRVSTFINDGEKVSPGDVVFHVEGASLSILQTERLVLNVMQRMSAIATKTAYYVGLVSNYNTQILDTRKTTPGLRTIEKLAVKIGGGTNHRHGLYDMIMLKDNHCLLYTSDAADD